VRALVTGAAGFIGSNLVPELLKLGHSVLVLDNFSNSRRENLPDNPAITIREGDVTVYKDIVGAVRQADVVFHMAAQVGNVLSMERPQTDLITNVVGTINLLQACHEENLKQIVLSSSSAIFGETQYIPVDEAHPKDPMSPYGLSKYAAERYCLILGAEYRLRVACLRYFNVYGALQHFNPYGNVLPIFAEKVKAGEPFTIYGDGEQTRDFIDVRDIVQANILAMQHEANGVYNIGTGVATTVNQLANSVIDASDKAVEIKYAPQRAGEVRDSVATIAKATKELSFQPSVTIEQGVRNYIAWFNSKN
jgi:UDP-glucose 4-epimerase